MSETGWPTERVIVWFSCGAASAVAAKEAITKYLEPQPCIVYCDTSASEHPDNERFFRQCESWLGVKIQRIASSVYHTVDEVFEKRRYMAGIAGAPCTVELKKMPRFEFQRASDTHIFGMTADEKNRIKRIEQTNPELRFDWLLRDRGITKVDCLDRLRLAGIELPAMYRLGYDHNNCIGCVKASSPKYWDKIRRDFPETFARRAKQCREVGARLARVKGKRVFIDDVPEGTMEITLDDLSCGPECHESAMLDEGEK